LARVKLETLDKADFIPVKEADLSHHLQNGKGAAGKKEGLDKNKENLDVEDYALHEALNLLKALVLSRNNYKSFSVIKKPIPEYRNPVFLFLVFLDEVFYSSNLSSMAIKRLAALIRDGAVSAGTPYTSVVTW